jgi:hypothetical protein
MNWNKQFFGLLSDEEVCICSALIRMGIALGQTSKLKLQRCTQLEWQLLLLRSEDEGLSLGRLTKDRNKKQLG